MPSKTVEVSATVAVLAALRNGAQTTPEIATQAKMSAKSVASTLARLRKLELVKRKNPKAKKPKPGVKGPVARYGLTRAGGVRLRKELKKLGVK